MLSSNSAYVFNKNVCWFGCSYELGNVSEAPSLFAIAGVKWYQKGRESKAVFQFSKVLKSL